MAISSNNRQLAWYSRPEKYSGQMGHEEYTLYMASQTQRCTIGEIVNREFGVTISRQIGGFETRIDYTGRDWDYVYAQGAQDIAIAALRERLAELHEITAGVTSASAFGVSEQFHRACTEVFVVPPDFTPAAPQSSLWVPEQYAVKRPTV